MSSLQELEGSTLAAIAGASDEASLENVRVGALGKKGAISALLATLVYRFGPPTAAPAV